MGDPAGEIWTAVPRMLSASYPPSIPLGTNSVTVTATSLGHPCAGAYVCLWKDGEVHVGDYTGSDGSLELPIHAGTAGDMLITVTKHDHHPHLATIRVLQADHYVGYFGHTIDDDDSGSSSGNSDHQPNPTEQLELPVWVRNYGTQTAHDVTGTLTSNDPYLTISDGSEVFGDIDPGTSVWSKDDFDVEIDAAAPNGHLIRLALDLQSGTESWHSLMDFAVVSAEFIYDDVTLYDMGSQLDPGDEGQISLRIRNAGDAPASDVSGTLVSHSDWITVTDAEGSFGSIDPGSAGENTTNRFGISVADNCFQGHVAAMALLLQFSDGARDTAARTTQPDPTLTATTLSTTRTRATRKLPPTTGSRSPPITAVPGSTSASTTSSAGVVTTRERWTCPSHSPSTARPSPGRRFARMVGCRWAPPISRTAATGTSPPRVRHPI
jgi:hypothetical protein